MGNLTDDMTRLRGEIDALRGSREALIQDLARDTKGMKSSVAAMLGDFSKEHADMTRRSRKSRMAFVSGVRKKVFKMKREMQNDLNGARKAWNA